MKKLSRDELHKKSAAWWKEQLSEEQYRVMRQKGTEVPYSGEFVYSKDQGTYKCSACGQAIFKSDTKYDSTTPGLLGWPSFSGAIEGSIEYKPDSSLGMVRTEVVCSNCGSHLGHLFDDEASPNGKHYCINSVCLAFEPKGGK
jgi:peptide-methionine (R)-S-oxide reductase